MNLSIPILFEDSDYLIVNKTAGVIVNRSETTTHETTIQDWAEKKLGITYQKTQKKYGDADWLAEDEFYNRGGIVHRLDKETSGVLIIAKSPASFVNLQKQFKERTVKKTYIALAHGVIEPKEGEIHVPVGRLPWNRNRFGVLPGARESKTIYKVLAYYQLAAGKEKLTLVELYPQSGRTHQIRVHLKFINHPVFSDFLYAGRKTARKDRNLLSRVFLHAFRIDFHHPSTGVTVSYEAPLAEELAGFLQTLEKI